MNLDERLENIHNKIAREPVQTPLPPRSAELSGRIEYTLNKEVLQRMEMEHSLLPKNWSWAVINSVTAAVKPAILPWCKRWEVSVKNRIRRLAEWLFKCAL